MPSAKVITTEYDLSNNVPAFPGITGLLLGNFEKGPVGEKVLITDITQAEKILGRPSINSDRDSYFTLFSYLTRADKCWVVRVTNTVSDPVAGYASYGGVMVAAEFNYQCPTTPDGVIDTFTFNIGKFIGSRLEVYLDKNKIAYDNAGTITGPVTGNLIDVGSTANPTTGDITIVFVSPPPAGSSIYVRWSALDNMSFQQVGLSGANALDVEIPELADPLTIFDNGPQLSMPLADHVLNVITDTLTLGNLTPPTNIPVTTINDATVFVYSQAEWDFQAALLAPVIPPLEAGYIAYFTEDPAGPTTPSIVNMTGVAEYDDVFTTGTVTYSDGSLTLNLNPAPASYVWASGDLTIYYKSRSAYSMVIYGDNPGRWSDNFDVIIQDVNIPFNSFVVRVQEFSDLFRQDAETPYTVSRELKVDGYGRQMNIMERLNDKSFYLRVYDNPLLPATPIVPGDPLVLPRCSRAVDQFAQVYTGTTMLGGDNGAPPSVFDYVETLAQFNNREEFRVNLIMDTLGLPEYQLSIAQLCDRELGGRGDCYGIAHTPFELEQSSNYINDLLNYRNYELKISTSWVGLYAGHVKVLDTYNNQEIWIPPTGFVGSVFSFTATNFEAWYPAAGWNRGRIPVLDVYRLFKEAERDVLYDAGINPLRFAPGKGIAVWGQKTLYGIPSALDRANVRWLLIVVENAIHDFLDNFLFEFNDEITRDAVTTALNDYLDGIRRRRGLYDFRVVCNESNNSPDDIDQYIMNVDYYLKPVRAVEYIKARAIVSRTGAAFTSPFSF